MKLHFLNDIIKVGRLHIVTLYKCTVHACTFTILLYYKKWIYFSDNYQFDHHFEEKLGLIISYWYILQGQYIFNWHTLTDKGTPPNIASAVLL